MHDTWHTLGTVLYSENERVSSIHANVPVLCTIFIFYVYILCCSLCHIADNGYFIRYKLLFDEIRLKCYVKSLIPERCYIRPII